MSQCPDCPDIPNGTRKRAFCCRRGKPANLKVGDVVPLRPKRLSLGPTFTGAGAPSFRPARHANRGPGK